MRKFLVLLLTCFMLVSCGDYIPTYQIEVTYQDGEKDTIRVVEHSDVWLDELQESPYINIWILDSQNAEFHDMVYDVKKVRRLYD